MLSACPEGDNEDPIGEDPPAATIEFEKEFENGLFTCGIDFPAGKYNFTAVSGYGAVQSSNYTIGVGINTAMGLTQGSSTVANVTLSKGSVLSLSKVKVKISSAEASSEALEVRSEISAEAIELSAGTHTSGTDFPAGVYSIEIVTGNGSIQSSNYTVCSGINAALGTNGTYATKFYNCNLPADTTLTVNGGSNAITIKLIPVK